MMVHSARRVWLSLRLPLCPGGTLAPLSTLVAFIALWVTSGCGAEGVFNITESGSATVAAGQTLSGQVFVGLSPVTLANQTILKRQDIKASRIAAATLDLVTLTVETPGGGADLSFLSQVDLYLDADGMSQVHLASQARFAAGTNLVTLEPNTALKLAPYLRAPNCRVSMTASGGVAPATLTLSLSLLMTLHVDNRAVLFE